MGFNLGNLLRQAEAQINPFDHGKTAATVRQQQQRPVMASLPSPNQPRQNFLQRAGNVVHNDVIAPVQRDIINPVNQSHVFDHNVWENKLLAKNPAAFAGAAGVVRSLAGTGQALSGLTDLATPGHGTSRVTKAFNNVAQGTDQFVKQHNLPSQPYHATQFIGDATQYALGSGEAKALGNTKYVKPVINAANHVEKAVHNFAAPTIKEGSLLARTGARAFQNIVNPKVQAGAAAFTAQQTGKEAAQGHKITPQSVAVNQLINGGAFPAAGAVAHEAAAPVINKGVQALRDTHLIRPTNLTDQELAAASKVMNANSGGGVSSMDLTSNDMAHFHNAQLKLGAKPGTPEGITAVNDALLQHQAYDSKVLQRKQALEAIKQQINESNAALRSDQNGFIAGPKAIGYKGAKDNGKVFTGVDGQPRFEVGDQNATLKNISETSRGDFAHGYLYPKEGATYKLSDILDHPQLYKEYPFLKDTKVVMDNSGGRGAYGATEGNTITLNPTALGYKTDSIKSTLLHELQHVIQDKEGFAAGGNPALFRSQEADKLIEKMSGADKRIFDMKYGNPVQRLAAPLRLKSMENKRVSLETEFNNTLAGANDHKFHKQYQQLAGEAEARAVEARAQMNDAARSQKPFYDSLDVPKDQLIVKTGDSGVVNGKAMSIEQPKTEDQLVVTQNRLTKGAKEGRQNLSPEAQKLVQGEGTVRNTKQLADEAKAKADSQSLDKTIQTAHESLAVEPGKIDDATVAHVQQAIERADAAGRTHDAVALHDSLSEHLRKQGQTIQAASLLYRLSPQGLLYKGMRDIKQSGTEVTPELETKLRAATDAIKQAVDPEAKMLAQATFHKLVADNLKKTTANKLLSVWKAGLLSGPLTHAGNFASNETFNALKTASNPVSAGVDRLLALKTGQRTKVATMRGVGSGTKQGMGQSLQTLKTGIDPRNIEGSKYEIHGELNFKNPIVQKVFGDTSNGVFRMMSAGDQPVYYRNLKQNLYDLGLADGKNKGLKGQQLVDHAEKLVANPTKQIAETAKLAAQKAVLGQDSKIASSISRIAQEHPALQAVIPFVKVPTNFLVRTMDFSPVGLGKAGLKLYQDAKAGRPFDQRALSEAIGEGLTGTALIAIGTHLANNNLLSGQYPSSDRKEAQRWKAEGIQPNSVKIGGKWINLNYLGPIGLLLGAGKDYHTAAVTGDNGAMQALAGFGKSLAGQSFLTGFSGAANAINDPGRYGSNFVHSQAASVVPSWLNAVGNATDSKQRQASSTLESVQSRLPGLRKGLPVKQDAYGNALPQRTGPVDMTIDPLKPSNDLSKKNQVVSEVSRLHNVDPNNSDLQVTPVPPTSLKIDGQAIKLNARQKYDLQTKTGQQIQQTWDKIIKTPEYKAMSDTDKAKTLTNARQDAASLATRQYVVDNNLGTYKKAASSSVAALAGGDVSRYLNGSTGSGTPIATILPKPQKDFLTKYNAMNADQRKQAENKQNDFEYNYLVAKYANDKANNKLSTVQDIKAREGINKALVGKDYSKQVRDLHSLNKGELYTYLTTPEKGVDKQKLANQVIAYDDALTKNGIQAKNKFRDKNGSVAIKPSSKRGSSGSGKGGRAATAATIASAFSSVNTNKYKYERTLRHLAEHASLGKVSGTAPKQSSSKYTPKLKSYKVATGTTKPKARKAFA